MNTTVLLVRHAVHDQVNHILVGRSDDCFLSLAGIRQARLLGEHLAGERFALLQSSPRERALETATQIAKALKLHVSVEPALDEIDTGDWTGRSFASLEQDPRWQLWNARRGSARIPNGESMQELQDRIIAHLKHTHALQRGGRVLMVSHAEPIRAAILHFRRMPLDDFQRISVDPGSITTLVVSDEGGELISENVNPLALVAA